jgi:hypothetical protein
MGNVMASCVSSSCPNFVSSSFDSGHFMSTDLLISECSLEPEDKSLGYDMESSMVVKKGEELGVDIQNRMRDASFLKNNGELPLHSECLHKNNMNTYDLSLVENDSVSHCPSIEEVIAFGGIPKPNSVVRSSARLGGQSNADMP